MNSIKQIVLKGTEEEPLTVLHITADGGITLAQKQLYDTIFISLGAEEKEKLIKELTEGSE